MHNTRAFIKVRQKGEEIHYNRESSPFSYKKVGSIAP